MSDFSNICRDLLDTKDTIKNKLSETLATELVSAGYITRDEHRTLLSKISLSVDQQVDGLVDRILAVEAKKAAKEAELKAKKAAELKAKAKKGRK